MATPTFSPASGASYVQFNVTVSEATSGSTIHYTLDNSTPTTSSPTVASGGTILISKSQTLKAYAVKSGYADSAMASATYQVTGQVATGQYHVVTLKTDGTVWAWGYDNHGQVGNGATATFVDRPVQVSGLSGVVEVGAGYYHSAALKSDGTVWAWGYNNNGVLGTNTEYSSATPVQVKKSNGSGGTTNLTNIIAISTGAYHNLALDSSGNVWAWGLNSNGQLGDGTTTQRNLAVPITLPSGVTVQALAAGAYHSFLITTSGAVYAWGLNSSGQLGDGTTTQRTTPVAVTALSGVTISELSGGSTHTVALQSDGSVWAWGFNSSGQVGDGTTTQRNSPVHLTSLSGVESIQAGFIHSVAMKADGTVWTWGANTFGEIGDGTELARSTPVQAQNISAAVNIAAGDEFTLALKSDGSFWGCGYAGNAQTGSDVNSTNATPSPILGLSQISTTSGANISFHSLFVGAGGVVYSIGQNSYGELGDGTTANHVGPDTVNMSSLVAASAVAAGRNHSLAVRASDGSVWAWGQNTNGQLGNNSTTDSAVPVQVSGLTGITSVAGETSSSLALKSDGTVWAWGYNATGQLGNGTYSQSKTPVQVMVSSTVALSNVKQIVGGSVFSAALKNDGTVWVWGVNTYHELGAGQGSQVSRPVEMADANDPSGYLTNVKSITVGADCVLAVKNDGTLWGWGSNTLGQLSNAVGTSTNIPTQISVVGNVTQVAVGYGSGYAQTDDGKTWSWGHNAWGELGDGTVVGHNTIAQCVGLSGFVTFGAGNYQAMALRENGTVLAWGDQNTGQCGFGANYVTMMQAPGFNANPSVPTPTVSITAPSNNAVAPLGSSLTFTASAAETGGTIASVSYYINSSLLGTSTTGSSYSVTWTPPTWGTFTFTAIATDTNGNTSYLSSPVTVQVPYDSDNSGAGNTLPDWWEMQYFGHLGNSASADSDGDGLTNLQEYQQHSDPTNYYSQGSTTITPTLTIVSGNNQTSTANAFTPQPLVVQVTNSSGGAPLVNAPITFSVASGGGQVSATSGGTTSTSLTVQTNASGQAQIYYQQPSGSGVASTINATTGGQSVTFTESNTGGSLPPINLTAQAATNEIDLAWINQSSSATSIQVQQQGTGGTWSTIATLSSTQTSYAVTGLSSGTSYTFQVVAIYTGSSAASNSVTDITATQIGWWKLDDGSGTTAADSSGSGNGGTVAGAPTWVTGISNDALQLNGTTQYVQVSNSTSLGLDANSLTLSCWFKASAASAVMPLFSKELTNGSGYHGFHLVLDAAGNLEMKLADSTGSSPLVFATQSSFTDSQWHQVIVQIDQAGQTGQIMVDGTLQNLKLKTGSVGSVAATHAYFTGIAILNATTTQALTLGAAPASSQYLNGTLDELHLYNHLVSSTELSSLLDSDGNGLPDWWEVKFLGHIGNTNSSSDPSGDGLTLLQAYQQGINPNDFYHGTLPVLQIVSGNNQVGPAGTVLPNPLVVRVENSQGQIVVNAPVSFISVSGGGQISATATGTLSSSLNLRSDTNGLVQVYLAPAGSVGNVNQVKIAAASGSGQSSVTFIATVGTTSSNPSPTAGGSGTGPTTDADPSPLATPTVTITPFPYVPYDGDLLPYTGGPAYNYTHITISWDPIPGATSYEVDRVDDTGTYNISTGSTTSCTDSGLYSGVNYQYQVHATAGAVRSEGSAAYSVPLIAAIAVEFLYQDGATYWVDELLNGNAFLDSYAYPEADVPETEDPDNYYFGIHIAYKFILNPTRTTSTFTWYDGSPYSSNSYSATTATTETASETVPNGSYTDAPNLGWNFDGGGNISGTGYLGMAATSSFDLSPSGTISWTGTGSSHFTVTGWDALFTGDEDANFTSGEAYGYGDYASFAYFYIHPNPDTVQPGDQIIITLADDTYGTKTFTYTYQPPTSGDYSMSVDEASGAKYRKIALNGLPMPDEKPQQTGETDQEQEETYIDALTVGLRHSTTDVYMPVSGSDLSVSSRRDFRPEVWNTKSGLRPHEAPDKPFGLCWSSNLAPNIHFSKSNNPQKTQPDQVQVTDETGAVHSFFIWQSGGTTNFFPMPTAKNEQQTPNLESLTLTTAGSGSTPAVYTFKKKYGSTLTYTMTPLTLSTEDNRIQASTYSSTNTYARLTQAVDRLGNAINYSFNQANDLVPSTISVANQPATTLSIQQQPVNTLLSGTTNTQNVITAIWDAKGNKTTFNYALATTGDTQTPCLTSVVTADGATTQYTYDIASETDTTPQPSTPTPPPFWHADLASITDPLNKTYSFTYTLDQSKYEYMNNPALFTGYYIKVGLPRNVHKVTQPDGTYSTFTNASAVGVSITNGVASLINLDTSANPTSAPGTHQVNVTDTTGFIHSWKFGNPLIVPLPAFKTLYNSSSMTDSKIICYQNLTLSYGDPSGAPLGSESFQFDVNSGMALSQITDFSGNVTTFAHTDAWTDSTGLYRQIMTNTAVNGFYGDPTSQTDALGHAKTFTYYGSQRIMQTSTDENGHKTYNDIDSLGRRTSEKIYDASNNLVQETDFAYGNTTYPGFMTQKTVKALGTSDPSWAQDLITQYTPDSNGRVAQETVDPSGLDLVTTTTYDANGNKQTVTDPRGDTTWFSYDSRNRLVTVTYADGAQKQMVYDARGNKTVEYDENGIATLYQYDALNRLITQARDMNGNGIIDSPDLVTSYTYNADNTKHTTTDPNGNVTTMAYDHLQRVTSITDALSHVTQFTYGTNAGGNAFDSAGFKPTHTVDPRGFATDVVYDALYRPTSKAVQYASGTAASTTQTSYDNVGNVTLTIDPVGNHTGTTYDALNRPLVTTNADSTTTQSFYSSTGFKWKTIDPNGHATQTQYDNAGRAIVVTGAAVDNGHGTVASPVTTTTYDESGNAIATVNPLGQEWDTTYDARNRKLQTFSPSVLDATTGASSHPVQTWQYDNGGRVIATIDARGNETDTAYDNANRVTDVNAPAVTIGTTTARPNTHSTYDDDGNILTLRDANVHTTTNTYDALNRLLTTTDAAGIVVTNTYDQVGNKLTVKDGKNQTTAFAYDGLNRNTTVTDAAGQVTTLAYDALNKTGRTDALGQITSYQYDNRNRLQHVIYSSGAAANSQRDYAYDNVGSLLSVTEPSKTAANVAYTYDALNRAMTETSGGKTHSYVYDLAGNRLKTVYGGTGRTLTSTYDALNRLSTLQEQTAAEVTASAAGRTTSYGYDLNGNIAQKTAPNGDKETYVYDALNRSTDESAQTGGNVSLFDYQYGYDLASNVLTVTETYPGGLSDRTTTNTYDVINRLHVEAVTGSAANSTKTYTYDNANNCTGLAVTSTGADTTTFSYNNLNQLTSYSDTNGRSVTVGYDYNGNRTSYTVGGVTDTYSYDFENRLISLTKNTSGGTGTYAYQYDYRTRRITRDESSASGVITHIIFSGGTSVAEYDGTNTTPTVEYIRGSDYGGGVGGVLYTVRSGTPSYTHANRRGDIVAKTDSSGNLTFQNQYDGEGDQVATDGSTLDRQKDNSKDTDPTGLINEGMRYTCLENGLRLFLTRDPAGFVDGPNLYTYVRQNPWTSFDPEGLTATDFFGGVGQGWGEVNTFHSPTYSTNNDREAGIVVGHVLGLAQGALEMGGGSGAAVGGTGMMAGGTVVSATGVGAVAGVPTAVVGAGVTVAGAAVAIHGTAVAGQSLSDIGADIHAMASSGGSGGKGEAPGAKSQAETKTGTDKEVGSYTNTHESGKTYDGKGTRERMNQTAKEKAEEHNDPVVKQEFTPAKNDREAFKDEDTRIQSHGGAGPQNPNTYNKINSPGKKYKEQDQKKEDQSK